LQFPKNYIVAARDLFDRETRLFVHVSDLHLLDFESKDVALRILHNCGHIILSSSGIVCLRPQLFGSTIQVHLLSDMHSTSPHQIHTFVSSIEELLNAMVFSHEARCKRWQASQKPSFHRCSSF
jgi:hypothetical protein